GRSTTLLSRPHFGKERSPESGQLPAAEGFPYGTGGSDRCPKSAVSRNLVCLARVYSSEPPRRHRQRRCLGGTIIVRREKKRRKRTNQSCSTSAPPTAIGANNST